MPAAWVTSIEEFINGPEGDEGRGIEAAWKQAVASAALEEKPRVQVEVRSHAEGQPSSRQETTINLDRTVDVAVVRAAVSNALASSPGEGFVGEVRLNFREAGQASNNWRSYTRQWRRPGGGTGASVLGGDAKVIADVVNAAVKPIVELTLRSFDENVRMQQAGAQMMSANAQIALGLAHFVRGDPTQPAGSQGGLGDLLKAAVGVASAAGSGGHPVAQVAGAAQHLLPPPAPAANQRPPSPVPHWAPQAPPSPVAAQPTISALTPLAPPTGGDLDPRRLTRAQVEEWAKHNEGDARAMVRDELGRRGLSLPGL